MLPETTRSLDVCLVPGEFLDSAFEKIRPGLQACIDEHSHGEVSAESVLEDLRSCQAQLWVLTSPEPRLILTCITRVLVYPGKRRLSVDFLFGQDLRLYRCFGRSLEDFARANGIDEIEARVRPGVTKLMAPFGYSKAYEVILKKVKK